MENKNIVIVGQQPWDTDIGSNCKNIAIELSRYNNVLYVNSPLDRITLVRSRKKLSTIQRLDVIKGRQPGLLGVADRLWNLYPDCMVESINWIKNSTIFNYFNKRNNRLLAKSILSAVHKLGWDGFILFNDNEIFKGFYLEEYLNPQLSIYYSRDYMVGVDYWKRHGERLEPLLIAKSDICFTNSDYLASYCARYNPNAYNVGQGCDIADISVYNNKSKPAELQLLKSPIIGYVGSLDSNRLNIEVIECIALGFPACSVVLVGPEDLAFRNSVLHEIKNIYFLGKKLVQELPLYINSFDVCINPQLVNPITVGNYPRKIDEYLAFGKPTVATRTETMDYFKDYVYLADTKEEYIELIQAALLDNSEQLKLSRIKFASDHTWDNSVKEMSVIIESHLIDVTSGRYQS